MPVRLRLTAAFAGAMAVVLLATGMFVYLRLGADLDATIDQGLRSRAGDVTALVQGAGSDLATADRSPLTEQGESLAQVLDPAGRVVDSLPALRSQPLLTRAQARRAARATLVVELERNPGGDEPVRLLATPVRARGRALVVVVGAPIDDRREALRNLGALLLVGGPVALLLASLAGYGVAAGALRPVEAMRRRAREIEAADIGERLPVPATRDEIARLGETLNGMLDRLEAAFQRERSFVADASHELRTPLAILKTELELALRQERSVGELQETLRSAAEETDRLSQLAEDLLVVARSDQGRLPIREGSVDVPGLLGSVAERFAGRARDAGKSIAVDAPPGLALTGDALRLEQALGNLVDNALRYGGRAIELVALGRVACVELHVRDDGEGFPDAVLPVAFERFTRGDPARSRGGGAGLGLAIVAAIAIAHDGAPGAENRPEQGADVWISVPAA
ncbi:MAG: ATP-binding protein [Solirubrobacteraceae bacterium]